MASACCSEIRYEAVQPGHHPSCKRISHNASLLPVVPTSFLPNFSLHFSHLVFLAEEIKNTQDASLFLNSLFRILIYFSDFFIFGLEIKHIFIFLIKFNK